jgi:hypothetical protein
VSYGEKAIELAQAALDGGDPAAARQLLVQDGKCGACGVGLWKTDRCLDEEEGILRGILCGRCAGSSLRGHSPSDLRGMADYLQATWDEVRLSRAAGWVAAWRAGSTMERIAEETGYPAEMIEGAVRKAATRHDVAERLTKMGNA